ncbi:X-Pro dipeptidyl-peptidase-domain-containing protein [Tribonema minus]|uniref:X-Pro dipeptidyl-peptidase-domain-containing protein n=1 Tax=Tribonema minus TaxID=303371 RepID=A0A835YUK7_9STRA|nr:X-Pro dipeptidyl-peptidase-domain-containing protein [Tribonema minus]
MRDGVKIAVDVWLPKDPLEAAGSLPCILHQSRYYRSMALRWPLGWLLNGGKPVNLISNKSFHCFLERGMAVVSMDVRGTGASFGRHLCPWSAEEAGDSLEVLDWMTEQPWGISYEGTAAFMTSLLQHPYMFWDAYDDLAYPGGVPMHHFTHAWQAFNSALDAGRVRRVSLPLRVLVESVSRVRPEDRWGAVLRRALREHGDNWTVHRDADVLYADDASAVSGQTVETLNASVKVQALLDAAAAAHGGDVVAARAALAAALLHYLHVSGWMDASASASLLAYHTLPCASRALLIGPWTHGGVQHVRLHLDLKTSMATFDFAREVSDFFVKTLVQDATSPSAAADAAAAPAAQPSSDALANGAAKGASRRLPRWSSRGKRRRRRPNSSKSPSSPPAVRYFVHQLEKWRAMREFPCEPSQRQDVSVAIEGGGALGAAEPLRNDSYRQEDVETGNGTGIADSNGAAAAAVPQGGGYDELLVNLRKDRDGEGQLRPVAYRMEGRRTNHLRCKGPQPHALQLRPVAYRMEGRRTNHLRYTGPPLAHDMEVTGYPIAQLWLSAPGQDNADVFVYLQMVEGGDAGGRGVYVTEGCLRVEHRKTVPHAQPIDARALPGVPVHTFRRADAAPLLGGSSGGGGSGGGGSSGGGGGGAPVLVEFRLMPTSFLFRRGQRVRVSVGGADVRHFKTLLTPHDRRDDGLRRLRVHTQPPYRSRVILPVAPPAAERNGGAAGGRGGGAGESAAANGPPAAASAATADGVSVPAGAGDDISAGYYVGSGLVSAADGGAAGGSSAAGNGARSTGDVELAEVAPPPLPASPDRDPGMVDVPL